MKKLLTVSLGLTLLLIFCYTRIVNAKQEEQYHTLTDVGEIVLTAYPCSGPDNISGPYPWHVFATDVFSGDEHVGCWNRDGDYVIIIWEEIPQPLVYDKNEFKPRPTL